MLTQTVEYALRATCYLAFEAPEARTTSQIAEATKVPQALARRTARHLSRERSFALLRMTFMHNRHRELVLH